MYGGDFPPVVATEAGGGLERTRRTDRPDGLSHCQGGLATGHSGRDGAGRGGTGRDGTGRDGTGRDGAGRDGTGRDGMGRDGTGRDGTGRDGTGRDGTGRGGTGRDGAGRDGAGRDGTGRDGTGRDGTVTADCLSCCNHRDYYCIHCCCRCCRRCCYSHCYDYCSMSPFSSTAPPLPRGDQLCPPPPAGRCMPSSSPGHCDHTAVTVAAVVGAVVALRHLVTTQSPVTWLNKAQLPPRPPAA